MYIQTYLQRLRKWLHGLQKKVQRRARVARSKITKLHGYIKFYSLYYFMGVKNKIMYWIYTRIFTVKILSFPFFLFIVTISYIAGWYINPVILNPQALTYFIAVAAMVGGIIAIIFPFKTLIMQNAADNTSAGFYRTLGKDKRQDIVFFVLVFSVVLFFVLALTATSYQFTLLNRQHDLLRIIFQSSIFVVGLDFYLVFLLFEMLFKRTDPFSGIALIQKTSIKYLDDIHKRATKFSDLMMLHPKTDKSTTKEEMLASTFQSFRTDLQYLSYRLNYLFDYHDKVLAKNERTASLVILDVIASILEKYFIIKKDSSLLLPSGFFFVNSSDSQEFLTPHMEGLVSVGEDYLKKEDSVGVKKVIMLFQELIAYAGEIKFVRAQTPDNPILMQLRGYLDQFMKSIMQKGFLEGMFQGAITYKGIGAVIIRKKMVHELTPVFEVLNKIAYTALLTKQDVVVSEVIKTYSALITVLMEDDWIFGHKIKLVLEHLQETVLYGFVSHNSRSIPHGRMQQELAEPYVVLANLIIRKSQDIPSIRDQRKREDAKSLVLNAAEELRTSIRYLAENIKNADSLLVGVLANTTRRIGGLLIHLTNDTNWTDAKRALEKEGSAYLHQPWWFTDGVDKIDDSLSFDELPEAVSKMGLVALDSNQDRIAEDATKVITDLATVMLTKEDPPGYGLTEPRIMVLACYLGIYSLKLGKTTIVAKLKDHITAFERVYEQKYFVDPRAELLSDPRRDQLMREVIRFMDNLSNRNRDRIRNPFENTEELLFNKVTVEDVKKFVKEIWNVKLK